jgi:hypothetical protein
LSEATGRATGSKPKKKNASAFRRPASSVFSAVIAGADEVVANSFIAQGAFDSAPTGPARVAPGVDLPARTAPAPRAARSPAASGPARVPAPAMKVQPEPRLYLTRATGTDLSTPQATAPATPERSHLPTDASKSPGWKSAPALSSVQRVADSNGPAFGLGSGGRADVPQSAGGWAHQALTESFVDAVVSSNTWTTHGFRIVPDVLNALKARLAADRRTSGNPKLAVGHYLDAALRHAPTDVTQQITTAQSFLAQRMGIVDSGRQSTYRIGPQARTLATTLNAALQEADHGRKGIFVVSACIQTLLNALETEGPLHHPTPPPTTT